MVDLRLRLKRWWNTEQRVTRKIDGTMAQLEKALLTKDPSRIKQTAHKLRIYSLRRWSEKKFRRAISLLEQAAVTVKGSPHEEICALFAKHFRKEVALADEHRRSIDLLLTPNS